MSREKYEEFIERQEYDPSALKRMDFTKFLEKYAL
jgi:hypothetical protein